MAIGLITPCLMTKIMGADEKFSTAMMSALESFGIAWRLLDAGVGVMPGSSFGQYADSLIRLSLTVPDEAIETAATRLISFTETLS